MDLHDYAASDATRLRELIAGGEVSATEVKEAALSAISAVEPQINALAHGPFEDASGSDGQFRGVPFAVKDTLWEAGRPNELGSRLLEGFKAPLDATLTERFRDAGLVTLARTATPEFTFNLDTAPVVNGATRNPWSLDRSPGGSSGGSAALVAAGAVPMAHANDGGGSIRIPAAWCGLVGLKPSRGRVPLGPLVGELSGGIAHEFAVTRTVRDTAALLDVVSGPAAGDRYYVGQPIRPFSDEVGGDPGRLRVALHTKSFWGVETEPEIETAVCAVARELEALGHDVEEAAAPVDADGFRQAHIVLWCWLLASIATNLGLLVGRQASSETVETASLACIEHGLQLSASDVAVAFAIQNAASRTWGTFLDDYDLFLCPTMPTGPTAAGFPAQDDATYTSAEKWLDDVFGLLPYTPIANTTGQPSMSLPLGTTSDGLPIGVMLTAQTLREDLLIRVAAQLEQAMPWASRRPEVAAQ